jgi:glycosyltransferase involved in cell wall biosynthesis
VSGVNAVPYLSADIALIVHSHLRWDFVWQRPQQLLSRMAATNPVLFVEEPVFLDTITSPALDLTTPHPHVVRAVPRLPVALGASYDDAITAVRGLLRDALRASPLAERFERVVQWFYTPMPAPEMLGAFGEEGVVYDCMDELANFRFAPADIERRERLLLSRADVVFTGGYRLFESKSRYHDNVHFFGCGVDAQHFSTARLEETVIPEDAAVLPRPVLGYFGAIDERLDYELLRALAAARPEWIVLMIGPVVKVDTGELPRAPNIRWLGHRQYAQLPAYLKAFDVCLMPFALNEATEFINPTKTLEYMAAGKPIVSTPVADVVRNFAHVVRVARRGPEFIGEVVAALEHPDGGRCRAGMSRAAAASWESIVQRMRELIAAALGMRAVLEGAARIPQDEVLPVDAAGARHSGNGATMTFGIAPDAGADAV